MQLDEPQRHDRLTTSACDERRARAALDGPLRKGAGLCHGTAGNGDAFLKVHERTHDDLWLERARAFAIHALEQAERARASTGVRPSLWMRDVALYLRASLDVDHRFASVDYW